MKLLLIALIAYLAKKGIIVLPFNLKWFSKKNNNEKIER